MTEIIMTHEAYQPINPDLPPGMEIRDISQFSSYYNLLGRSLEVQKKFSSMSSHNTSAFEKFFQENGGVRLKLRYQGLPIDIRLPQPLDFDLKKILTNWKIIFDNASHLDPEEFEKLKNTGFNITYFPKDARMTDSFAMPPRLIFLQHPLYYSDKYDHHFETQAHEFSHVIAMTNGLTSSRAIAEIIPRFFVEGYTNKTSRELRSDDVIPDELRKAYNNPLLNMLRLRDRLYQQGIRCFPGSPSKFKKIMASNEVIHDLPHTYAMFIEYSIKVFLKTKNLDPKEGRNIAKRIYNYSLNDSSAREVSDEILENSGLTADHETKLIIYAFAKACNIPFQQSAKYYSSIMQQGLDYIQQHLPTAA